MKTIFYKSLIAFAAIAFVACEDVIFPTLENAEPIYVVDAWITNKQDAPQVVKLTRSQPYFENLLPPGVSGAVVSITDNEGVVYDFLETANAGVYVWTPAPGDSFGVIGRTYTLTIEVNGQTLTAETKMKPVPPIEKISFALQKGNSFSDDLYLAEFFATDLVPIGDVYWIKTWKNGQLLNKPADINIAYDALFNKVGEEQQFQSSGVPFILPIRLGVNPFDEDEDGNTISPYVIGDSLYVEINSLSEASFNFLNEVIIQTDRPGGFAELFSTPLANVSTNLVNTTPNGTKVVGFFNVASVAGNGRRFKSLDEIERVFE